MGNANPTSDRPSRDDKRGDSAPAEEDGVLDSIGKAITDPMKSGAEEEEPRSDGRPPVAPG